MKLIYLIYSWTNPKAGCEFIDCIYFTLCFQTPFMSFFMSFNSVFLVMSIAQNLQSLYVLT